MERTADTLIGRVLDGRYRVGPKIARGGMAGVYEATDLRLDRTVAVKVMHEGLADDEEFVRRFQREARSAARLSHPNVVSVFDTGDDDGTLFLVMEYVPGLTLRDLVRKEAPMSAAKALALLEPMLSALAAAHDAGILHRDVKPENVLLADDGRIKVADFGLSRAINSETQHTATGGVLIGTVSYLAPELVVSGKADARADVYAAGVVLYEMLTGQKPHQADSPIQVAYKHVHEDIPPPSAIVPGLPPYVDALVARATARDVDYRPADARVLLHQVRRVRQALDQGVYDDADLVADLVPTTSITDREGRTPTGELPVEIVAPRELVEIAEYEAATPPPARRTPVLPPRKRRRRGAIWLVIVLVLAVMAGLAAYYYGVARYRETPSVLDLTSAQAKAELGKAGLGFDVDDTAYSETVAKGLVIRSAPDPGDRVLKNGTVGVVLSLGPERHAVPAVAGRTLDDAQAMLEDAKLSFGDAIEQFSEAVAKGRVISASPAIGELQRRDTAVDLYVSKGPKPIAIPDLTGRPADRAEQRLSKLGFEVDTDEANSDTVPLGRVVSQDPKSGQGKKGDTIKLVVSKGPVLVEVPDVKGMGLDAATSRLEAAGFKVQVQRSSLYVGVMYVVGTNPSGGTAARKGSTVIVSVV